MCQTRTFSVPRSLRWEHTDAGNTKDSTHRTKKTLGRYAGKGYFLKTIIEEYK